MLRNVGHASRVPVQAASRRLAARDDAIHNSTGRDARLTGRRAACRHRARPALIAISAPQLAEGVVEWIAVEAAATAAAGTTATGRRGSAARVTHRTVSRTAHACSSTLSQGTHCSASLQSTVTAVASLAVGPRPEGSFAKSESTAPESTGGGAPCTDFSMDPTTLAGDGSHWCSRAAAASESALSASAI